MYKRQDWNGDGWINELDEHPLTNTGERPLINFGLTFNASWKMCIRDSVIYALRLRWMEKVIIMIVRIRL